MMLAPVLTPHGLLMLVQSLEAEGEAPALEPEHGLRLEKALKLPFPRFASALSANARRRAGSRVPDSACAEPSSDTIQPTSLRD